MTPNRKPDVSCELTITEACAADAGRITASQLLEVIGEQVSPVEATFFADGMLGAALTFIAEKVDTSAALAVCVAHLVRMRADAKAAPAPAPSTTH